MLVAGACKWKFPIGCLQFHFPFVTAHALIISFYVVNNFFITRNYGDVYWAACSGESTEGVLMCIMYVYDYLIHNALAYTAVSFRDDLE